MPWGAAIGAVATVGSAYLSKSGSKATQSSKDPAYVESAKQDLVQRGRDLSNREYTPYTGARVQGASDNELSAFDKAKQGSGEAKSYFDKAGGQLDSMEDFNSENIGKYMNPYVDATLQPQLREQNKQYDRAKTELGNSRAGAWGGDRQALRESALESNHMQNISDLTGKTYSEAYESATKNFFNDSARKQQSAQSYQRLGEGIEALNTQDIQNLMATGGTERLLKQAGLDQSYAQFLEKRDWDVNNLDTLIKSIQGATGNQTTTRTTNDGKNGALGQVLGAGATLAGMYFSGKAPVKEGVTSSTYTNGQQDLTSGQLAAING